MELVNNLLDFMPDKESNLIVQQLVLNSKTSNSVMLLMVFKLLWVVFGELLKLWFGLQESFLSSLYLSYALSSKKDNSNLLNLSISVVSYLLLLFFSSAWSLPGMS